MSLRQIDPSQSHCLLRVAIGVMLTLVSMASAQSCEPELTDSFPSGDTDDRLTSLAVATIQGQELLFAVDSSLSNAGGFEVSSIAQLDGTRWSALSSEPPVVLNYIIGVDKGPLKGLCATGGGGGVYHWDGITWTLVGGAFDNFITAIALMDSGNGPELYVTGPFSSVGGIAISNIARFDGTSWQPLGLGVDGIPTVLATDDVANVLYVGGSFLTAGGLPANNIAAWDGAVWTPMTAPNSYPPKVMAIHDDGSGRALYMGTSEKLWRLGLTGWEPIGPEARIHALHNHDTGNGFELFVSQEYRNQTYFRKLEDNDIVNVEGADVSAVIYAMASYDLNGAPMLYLGGDFHTVGETTARHIARYDGERVMPINSSLSYGVLAIEEYALNGPKAVYVGGRFGTAGDRRAKRIAKWDGNAWSPLSGGITQGNVYTICGFDDGSGPALFVGGSFGEVNGVSMLHIAKWDGSEWLSLGDVEGFAAHIDTIRVFDDGTGPAIYAAGKFTSIGGVPANSIAKWDGIGWQPLGQGIETRVFAMEVFDDGRGPALCVAGVFTAAGGQPASNIASWRNGEWTAISLDTNRSIDAIRSWDDGTGPALYIGGQFTTIGGLPIERLAKWDGAQFLPATPSGMTNVHALEVFDDGTGEDLYIGVPTGSTPFRLAPSVYSLNGGALEPQVVTNESVHALHATSMGGEYSLFIGGDFIRAGAHSAGRITQLRGCVTCYADCDQSTGPGILDLFDFLCFQGSFVSGESYACDCDTTTGPLVCDLFDFLCFQGAFVGGCP